MHNYFYSQKARKYEKNRSSRKFDKASNLASFGYRVCVSRSHNRFRNGNGGTLICYPSRTTAGPSFSFDKFATFEFTGESVVLSAG